MKKKKKKIWFSNYKRDISSILLLLLQFRLLRTDFKYWLPNLKIAWACGFLWDLGENYFILLLVYLQKKHPTPSFYQLKSSPDETYWFAKKKTVKYVCFFVSSKVKPISNIQGLQIIFNQVKASGLALFCRSLPIYLITSNDQHLPPLFMLSSVAFSWVFPLSPISKSRLAQAGLFRNGVFRS